MLSRSFNEFWDMCLQFMMFEVTFIQLKMTYIIEGTINLQGFKIVY